MQETHLLPCSSPFPLGLLFLAAESTLTNSLFLLLHFLLLRQVRARTEQLHSGESSTAHSLPTGWGQGLGGLAAHCITMLPSRARERARTVFKTPGSGEEWFGWEVLWGPHKERPFLTVRTPCGPHRGPAQPSMAPVSQRQCQQPPTSCCGRAGQEGWWLGAGETRPWIWPKEAIVEEV